MEHGIEAKYRQVAVDRAAFVSGILAQVGRASSQAGRLCHQKTFFIEKILTKYNSTNSILYTILGNVSKSTLYAWLRDYQEGGIDALVPHYGKPPKITEGEKGCIENVLIVAGNERIGNLIIAARCIMRMAGVQSASSASTLRRWIERYRHGDAETRRRGEKD